jgi:TPR repeat protein
MGRGDDALAAVWYRKAADQGFAAAQYQLGRLYYLGHGVAKNDAEAARWYWKAADQGDHNAENELGTLYVSGDGVPLDFKQAVALFRRAVQGAQPQALFNLALSYDKGWGMPRNPIAAYLWYGITERWSDADDRAKAATNLDRLSREISPAELVAAKSAAANWKPGSRGHIGVAIADLTPETAKSIGSLQSKGVVIRTVEAGSPAAAVGLQPGDVITAVDDQPVIDRASLLSLIGGSVPGQTVELLVEKSAFRGSLQLVRVAVAAVSPPR